MHDAIHVAMELEIKFPLSFVQQTLRKSKKPTKFVKFMALEKAPTVTINDDNLYSHHCYHHNTNFITIIAQH